MRADLRIATLLLAFATGTAAGGTAPAAAIQQHEDDLKWGAGPPTLPSGTKVVVLEGNPREAGIFTMRLRVEEGATIVPHTHPRAERVTVLSGKVGVGFGESFDREQLHFFTDGDFYVNPPRVAHYVYFARDSEVQITAEGPWEVHYFEAKH